MPAALVLLLSAIFGGAAAVNAVDARTSAAVSFLSAHGWAVEAAACETAEVAIPARFGPVYEDYNALQLSQGFDLTPYRGAVLTRCTFPVTDPPAGADGPVFANVFFDGNTVVAADVCSVGVNGWIRGVVGQ